jgi:hypothetical protein
LKVDVDSIRDLNWIEILIFIRVDILRGERLNTGVTGCRYLCISDRSILISQGIPSRHKWSNTASRLVAAINQSQDIKFL